MNTPAITSDYHCHITVNVAAKEAFDNIGNVAGWWDPDLKGSTRLTNDRFTVPERKRPAPSA